VARIPVIYQPHCFAFLDTNRSTAARLLFRNVERLLAKRTATFVTLSKQEYDAARDFRSKAHIQRASNVSHLNPPTNGLTNVAETVLTEPRSVVMIGRLTSQKNPAFFAQVANEVARTSEQFQFVWIGDGDPDLRRLLERNGIIVTGWLDKNELSERLAKSWLYLHSADYEGFPISVLDAASFGIPIIVRDLPCFEESGLAVVPSGSAAASAIIEIANDESRREELIDISERLTETMSAEVYRRNYSEIFHETNKRTQRCKY
jgi:glycosyltransferase involved in cell wall biosynthesis